MNKVTIVLEEDEFGNITVNDYQDCDGESTELLSLTDYIMSMVNIANPEDNLIDVESFDMRKKLKIVKR